jgi:hypothetical protein
MELLSCPNCLTVYGDVQEECPTCGARPDGSGADLELDVATRTAISSLGGVYGGIVSCPDDAHLFWCSRGVCVVEDALGLRWSTAVPGRVVDVSVESEEVRVRTDRALTALHLADGTEVE